MGSRFVELGHCGAKVCPGCLGEGPSYRWNLMELVVIHGYMLCPATDIGKLINQPTIIQPTIHQPTSTQQHPPTKPPPNPPSHQATTPGPRVTGRASPVLCRLAGRLAAAGAQTPLRTAQLRGGAAGRGGGGPKRKSSTVEML